jgi:glycosyltransferase involved in cell wall biosynthesis
MNDKKIISVAHPFIWFSIRKAGGTSDLMFKLIKAQENNSTIKPLIVTSSDNLDYSLKSKLKKTTFIVTKNIIKIFNLNYIASPIKKLKKLKPDIFHLHAFRTLQNVLIYLYCIKTNTPYIIDAHGSVPYWNKSITKKKIFDILIGKKIMLNARAWIAETEVGKNEYLEYFPELKKKKIDVISPPFGVDEFLDLPNTSNEEFRKKYNLSKNSKIISFLGRLHECKGNDFLLRGIAKLSKQRKDIICMLVGPDDGHETYLRQLCKKLKIEDRVFFLGYKAGRDKNEILQCSDIVVQLSRFEQGAWAPMEGVLSKTPIIVTDHTGTGEDIKRLDAGYLVEMDNIEDLCRKINYIFDNFSEAKNKTLIARNYIIKNLSMEARMNEYIDVYHRALNIS